VVESRSDDLCLCPSLYPDLCLYPFCRSILLGHGLLGSVLLSVVVEEDIYLLLLVQSDSPMVDDESHLSSTVGHLHRVSPVCSSLPSSDSFQQSESGNISLLSTDVWVCDEMDKRTFALIRLAWFVIL